MAFIDRMKGQDYIDATRKYLNYVEEHLENVRLAFDELSRACDGMWWVGDDMSWHHMRHDVEHHDLSKFSRHEFTQYRAFFYPVDDKDKAESGFEAAWEHHKRCNHHHHETVSNYADMVHMIIDWTAMSYKFGGTAQEYYEKKAINDVKFDGELIGEMYVIFEKLKAYREKKLYEH